MTKGQSDESSKVEQLAMDQTSNDEMKNQMMITTYPSTSLSFISIAIPQRTNN